MFSDFETILSIDRKRLNAFSNHLLTYHALSVEGACAASRYEPDLSLNLEICEMINKKQGNTYVIAFVLR